MRSSFHTSKTAAPSVSEGRVPCTSPAVAAYASYEHQRDFALHGGADPTGAALWPLSVDGLLVLATGGLLKPEGSSTGRMRCMVRLAFGLGSLVSLAANIAAAPSFSWQRMLVAG